MMFVHDIADGCEVVRSTILNAEKILVAGEIKHFKMK
jgi:hypothetical protein